MFTPDPQEVRLTHTHPYAARQLAHALTEALDARREVCVMCIGTDRSTGDALGPLVGTRLQVLAPHVRTLGTLEDPVHAANLREALERVAPNAFVIAIDACLGKSANIGAIAFRRKPLTPGSGVRKTLPPVGDVSIIGIVNIGGFMEYLVLQNTRLSLVMKMADVIAEALALALALWEGRCAHE